MLNYRLRDGLARLADGGDRRLGVVRRRADACGRRAGRRMPAPDARHRPAGRADEPPRRIPLCRSPRSDVRIRAAGIKSIGVPDLLLCRQGTGADLVAAVVDVLATDAPQLVPPYVRGLQYLDAPSMIQTGLIPLQPGAVECLPEAARLKG